MLDRNQLANGKKFVLIKEGTDGFTVIKQGSEVSPANAHQVLVKQPGVKAKLMSITNLMIDGIALVDRKTA